MLDLSLYDAWTGWINAPIWISIPAPFVAWLIVHVVTRLGLGIFFRSLPDPQDRKR